MKKKLVIEIEVEVDLDINQHDEIEFTLNQDNVIKQVKDAIETELYDSISSLLVEYKQYKEDEHAADIATQRAFDKYHDTH